MIEDMVKRYNQYIADNEERITNLRRDKPLRWEQQSAFYSGQNEAFASVLSDFKGLGY